MSNKKQTIYAGYGTLSESVNIITGKPLVVCEHWTRDYISPLLSNAVYFHDFTPNPEYDDVLTGINLFENEGCSFIVSLGGGSAIDVAKGINIINSDSARAKHLAIPTTAGTGSESTKFSILYKDKEKLSMEHEEILPNYVILDPALLESLPVYHKKSSFLDAICQAIEAMWCKASTPESVAYSKDALDILLKNMDGYFADDKKSFLPILQGANLAGNALNITKSTAPHAMSYKLASIFGIAHGHAVALCMQFVWQHFLQQSPNLASDPYIGSKAFSSFSSLLKDLGMLHKFEYTDATIAQLVASVNVDRLNNHPVHLDEEMLASIYREVLSQTAFA